MYYTYLLGSSRETGREKEEKKKRNLHATAAPTAATVDIRERRASKARKPGSEPVS